MLVPKTSWSPPVKKKLLTIPRRCLFCGSFLLFMFRVFHIHYSLVATCLERANLLALLYVMYSCVSLLSHVVSCVMYGTWLYWFQIFAFLLIFNLLRALKFRICPKALEQMYISYVRSLLEYCDSVWDNALVESKKQLNDVHIEATRIITGVIKLCSIKNL